MIYLHNDIHGYSKLLQEGSAVSTVDCVSVSVRHVFFLLLMLLTGEMKRKKQDGWQIELNDGIKSVRLNACCSTEIHSQEGSSSNNYQRQPGCIKLAEI